MSRFSIRNPYLIVVLCLVIAVVGGAAVIRMPVDMFPSMNIPVVVVATFYNGMPPQQIETSITLPFERFFTLGSGIEHIESRSLTGVSVIKVYFQPGTDPNAAVTTISNLAMAQLRRLPPGTLPPVVLKMDASSQPVCLVTFKGQGLNETQLRDQAQFNVRNQLANVPGASVPQPFGGRYRQIMVYADPNKLEAYQMSPMDLVRSINLSNLILPAGDVQIGPLDYNIYTNAQVPSIDALANLPVKTVGTNIVRVSDIGAAKDSYQIQTNVVRVDGQRSVYVPVLKQGGDTNTIAVVDGVRDTIQHLFDIPKELVTNVVFDQSRFVKTAIETLLHEGGMGLFLTSLMILVFLGSFRATIAVFFSIPLSALATFIALQMGGSSINSMVLGGLALAFSRLIDNSVVVLENIFRHLEMGESPEVAAEEGGREVALPVLAATLTTVVVFFPVTFLYGVSKFLFSALALAVALSLFASYAVAMTVVPLFCARFIKHAGQHTTPSLEEDINYHAPKSATLGTRLNAWFNSWFERFLTRYDAAVAQVLKRPVATLGVVGIAFVASLALYPLIDMSFFPRTDAGQFLINIKAPTGTRLDLTEAEIQRVEGMIRRTVRPEDLGMLVSNIGSVPDFSAIYSQNSGMHTATVQVALKEGHSTGSYEYMSMVKENLRREFPELTAFFQSGGIVDAVLNSGRPAPIDVQVAGSNMRAAYQTALELQRQIQSIPNVADAYIPQDIDYPALQLDINRERAAELGLDQREVVDNVITALTSNMMIAPSYWVDPKNGNNYMLTVQYPAQQIKEMSDLRSIPLRGPNIRASTRLDMVSSIKRFGAPTEVDHYQIRRAIDVYVRPLGEDLARIASSIDRLTAQTRLPPGVSVTLRGLVQAMRASFRSFALGLILAVVLLYLILVAQFRSFVDPFIIMLALPPGITGVIVTLILSHTTLNVMSLMGVVMLAGIALSNSILIVEFAHHLLKSGKTVSDAIATSCRVRLRPVLMTSLATIIGLLPMALKLGEGSESYAPLARALLGGLTLSVLLTVFVVPAAFLVVYRNRAVTNFTGGSPVRVCRLITFSVAACSLSMASTQSPGQVTQPSVPRASVPAPQAPPAGATHLTLPEAEQLALKQNPQVSQVSYEAKAYEEIVKQFRSAYFPTLEGDFTAVGANSGSRLAAGALNNPIVYSRVGTGLVMSQLITDFGRTKGLVGSASLDAEARQQAVNATRSDIVLRVDGAYLAVLRTRSLLSVAKETVQSRQLIVDQVSELFRNKLKSSLDLSFANVNLADAQLMLAAAQNDVRSAETQLSRLLALAPDTVYDLAPPNIPQEIPDRSDALIKEALQKRPDLHQRRLEVQASQKFAKAEQALSRPSVGLLGSAGYVPAGEAVIPGTYGAVGLNVRVPIFNGGLFRARRFEAESRAASNESALRDLELKIQRDVRLAWIDATNAREKLGLTQKLLDQAKMALDLAQARYNLGLSSMVELSQSQLQYTSAEIAKAGAQFDYDAQLRVLMYQVGR